MQHNRNMRQINEKKNHTNFKRNVLICGIVIWLFLMLNLCFSGYPLTWIIVMMIVFTFGAVVVTLVLIRPGDASQKIGKYGFWRYILSGGHPAGRGNQRSNRRRQRQNRR
ncbi:hypothetical protein QUW45_08890 [Limosilactobacillus pontis]|uniref:hypothetical protein n=1 Tax=Limosilactobacillus pontis TaxID=35787 RepID=UPI0025A4351B|nr:hypothetical protein [Limosilactobacillus pontis]MDM8332772.1 hypothetical protein [Limosilactobacillus pontis]